MLPGRRVVGRSLGTAIGVFHRLGQGAHVPFAKIAGGVALRRERLVDGELTFPEMAVVGGADAGAVVMATSHHRGTSRRKHTGAWA